MFYGSKSQSYGLFSYHSTQISRRVLLRWRRRRMTSKTDLKHRHVFSPEGRCTIKFCHEISFGLFWREYRQEFTLKSALLVFSVWVIAFVLGLFINPAISLSQAMFLVLLPPLLYCLYRLNSSVYSKKIK